MKKVKKIKLSIIIPIYNAEKYLEKCLTSILNNENYNYEVIIVNDGSTDSSNEIISSYDDSRIKIFNNQNSGVSYSRNFGLKQAIGEYVMFVDADDCLSENWNKIVFEQFDTSFDVAIFSNIELQNNKIDLLKAVSGANKNGICIGAPFSKVFNKKFLDSHRIEFERELINGEDMIFNLEVLYKAKNIKVIKKSIYLYRFTPGSATNRFDDRIFENDIKFNNKLNSIIPFKNEYKEILDYCLINGLYTIIHRISFCPKYLMAKRNYLKIDKEIYNRINYNCECFSKFKKIIIKEYIKENYIFVYFVLRFINISKKIIKGKEFYKEI